MTADIVLVPAYFLELQTTHQHSARLNSTYTFSEKFSFQELHKHSRGIKHSGHMYHSGHTLEYSQLSARSTLCFLYTILPYPSGLIVSIQQREEVLTEPHSQLTHVTHIVDNSMNFTFTTHPALQLITVQQVLLPRTSDTRACHRPLSCSTAVFLSPADFSQINSSATCLAPRLHHGYTCS